jgi:nicotinate-nucleotide adenylyltransferase
MRTLCFGGTFNPIHYGHLIGARCAAESAGFDRVMLIPCMQPPHKQGDTKIAAPEHRLAMCRLAIEADPLFEVSEIELQRSGPSYTIDTARELKSMGWSSVHWLVGADMAKNLPLWHKPVELLAEVQFLLIARPGWTFDWSTMPAEYRHLEQHIVRTPLIEISSTSIRDREKAGKPISYLTPPGVADYIRRNNLYR